MSVIIPTLDRRINAKIKHFPEFYPYDQHGAYVTNVEALKILSQKNVTSDTAHRHFDRFLEEKNKGHVYSTWIYFTVHNNKEKVAA